MNGEFSQPSLIRTETEEVDSLVVEAQDSFQETLDQMFPFTGVLGPIVANAEAGGTRECEATPRGSVELHGADAIDLAISVETRCTSETDGSSHTSGSFSLFGDADYRLRLATSHCGDDTCSAEVLAIEEADLPGYYPPVDEVFEIALGGYTTLAGQSPTDRPRVTPPDPALQGLLRAFLADPTQVDNAFLRMSYFSLITVTTIGFGDIVPTSDGARLAVAVEVLLGLVFAGLFLNALALKASGSSATETGEVEERMLARRQGRQEP